MSKFEMDQDMNANCETFRAELSAALEGRPQPEELGPLGWNEHLLGCGACRELLEAEEALEVLLASLPEPHLPPELVRRLLARLALERTEAGLDRLLEEAPEPHAPLHLARRILEGLDSDRQLIAGSASEKREVDRTPIDRAAASGDANDQGVVLGASATHGAPAEARDGLDELLESLPAPRIPNGLAPRVLHALESARSAQLSKSNAAGASLGRVVNGGFPAGNDGSLFVSRRIFAAAALVLIALGFALWSDILGPRGGDEAETDKTLVATKAGAENDSVDAQVATLDGATAGMGDARELSSEDPDQEFFEDFEVLENWELLVSEDLDLLLASVDGFDQLVLEFGYSGEDEAAGTEDGGGG